MATAMSGLAQKVSNKLNFQKGQQWQMTIRINSTMTSAMGEGKVDATVVRLFDVQDANGTSATIGHKIRRLQFNATSALGAQEFDSDNAKDMNSEAGKVISKSLQTQYTMTLDATGKVMAVQKDEKTTSATKDPNEEMMSNLMSQMAEGLNAPAPGDNSDFRILPDHEVGRGESWTDSVPNRKTVYTLADLTDSDIIITYTEDATIATKQEAMGMQIHMNSKDRTTGRITLDRRTGLLKAKTASTSSEGTMEAMGQSAPTSKKISRSWTVTAG